MAHKYDPSDCPHPDYINEISDFGGQKTGDIICTGCGEMFIPTDPEYKLLKAGKPGRASKATKN